MEKVPDSLPMGCRSPYTPGVRIARDRGNIQRINQVIFKLPLWRVLLIVVLLAGVTLQRAPVRAQAEAPLTNAEHIIILSDFNEILYERNSRQRIPLASLTKLMTAIVAVRHAPMNMPVVVHPNDLIGEATMGLIEGDELLLEDLFYGLLIPSGNDAAMAIARSVGWQEGDTDPNQSVNRFVDMMNATAREIGLRDTHFMNPHGLDQPGHYSTPYDVAIMLRAALNYQGIRVPMTTLSIRAGGSYDLYSNNPLLNREDYLGGKTGLTDGAGFCLASAARRDGRMVIAVVMRDDWNWYDDVAALLDYGLQLAAERGTPAYARPEFIGSQLDQPRPQTLVQTETEPPPFIGPVLPGATTARR